MEQNTPAWFPDLDPNGISLKSNIYKFMRAQNCSDFSQLFTWSVQQRDQFWQAAIESVDIKFAKKYTQVLDINHGVEKPNWLVNAELNIVTSCFKAPAEKLAIIYQDHNKYTHQITYGELHKLVNRVSNSILAMGLKPGDAIAIDMTMTVEAVAIYLAIIQAGCIAVGIAESFAEPEIDKRLKITHANLIFTQDEIVRDGKHLPLYSKILAINPCKIIVLPINKLTSNIKLRANDLLWSDFLLTKDQFEPYITHPHSVANILFSSGTTGDPKAIVWDHTSPIKCAVDGYFYQDIQPQDIIAWPSSLGWMMGPWLIYATLINQACMALYYDAPTTAGFTRFVADTKVTILGVVPSLVKNWRANNYISGLDWSHIKLFTSTGETSNYSDMQYLMQQAGNKPMIEYCGGTEISGAYITSTVLHANIPGAFSTPTLGLDIRLINEFGNYVDNGEVAIIPPSIGLSRELLNRDNFDVYYASMAKSSDGLVLRKHGDAMLRLSNGYYKSLGRADDAMNLGGIKISAAEIEHSLLGIAQIVETAAIGVSGPDGITQLVVYAVPVSGAKINLSDLQNSMQMAIRDKLNPLFKVSAVKIIDELPRTSSNKIMRRLLR